MQLSYPLSQLTPAFVQENIQLILFFAVLTYVLFLVHWIVSTDWEAKLNWFSLIVASTGLLYLHYSNALFVQQYELLFVVLWGTSWFYHFSTWNNNYKKVCQELNERSVMASLRPFQGSILRFFITVPRTKNPSNQWESPPFRNAIHITLIILYSTLLSLHTVPFLSPLTYCSGDISPLCCRYNYVIEGFDTQSVSKNFCSGPVRIAFAGSWSTGKTTIINALLGHNYSTSQIAPAPTTDKFVCLTMGAPYSGPVQSDDYESRKDCEMMGHMNDVTHKVCGKTLPNVLDVADVNTEFQGFAFFDMPGWQNEYGQDCTYRTFYQQLIEKMDFVYVVWDLNHGKIEEEFAEFFQGKARGTNFEVVYNRFESSTTDMAFLNQQYAKMSNGQELLSEMYTIKIHEKTDPGFHDDILHLRAKIQSVNQTVHDNRKKLMKDNLLTHQSKMTGLLALRKLKIIDRLVKEDLNVHSEPKRSWFRQLGIEL
jgi:GTPase SAR1 family protein